MSALDTPPEPSPAAPGPRPSRLHPALARRLALGLALVSAALLGLALFALVPEPAPTEVRRERLDPAQLTEVPRLPGAGESRPPVHRLLLWSFPICQRAAQGARLFRLAVWPDREAFAVWCRDEYVLVEVDARSDPPRVARLGRFAVRGELPGGATALDLDADGTTDLALGVSPGPGVVHRAFSGVFWLRGRPEGGYELPRALVEMPTVALASADFDGQPGEELAVLTRGDPVAQRPGELWLFRGGPSPRRVAMIPTALAPTDLALREPAGGRATDAWVVSSQPGSLLRLRVPHGDDAGTAPEVVRTELPLRGAQAWVAPPSHARGLHVRDAVHVQTVLAEPTPKLTPWLNDVRVGPAAWLDLDGDQRPELLAAVQSGFTLVRAGVRRDRALPSGVEVVDASSVSAALTRAQGVLLVAMGEPEAQLALVILPAELRDEASEVELRGGSVEVSAAEARVALE